MLRLTTVVYPKASCAENTSFPPALGIYDDSHRFSAHISTFIIVSRLPCTLYARVLSARPDRGLYNGVRPAPLGSSSPLICALRNDFSIFRFLYPVVPKLHRHQPYGGTFTQYIRFWDTPSSRNLSRHNNHLGYNPRPAFVDVANLIRLRSLSTRTPLRRVHNSPTPSPLTCLRSSSLTYDDTEPGSDCAACTWSGSKFSPRVSV